MMMKDRFGGVHRVDYIGNDNGKATIYINNKEHILKMYYRNERTWDDHMGNTPFGYYVNIPLPTLHGIERKRMYLFR